MESNTQFIRSMEERFNDFAENLKKSENREFDKRSHELMKRFFLAGAESAKHERVKFEVTKTSVCGEDRPCDDERLRLETVNINGGKEKKDLVQKNRWVIEIDGLQDLLKFISENEDLAVITVAGEDMPSIEIYDDYRE